MGWLIALAVLAMLAGIPLGVLIRYDSDGLLVRVIAGFLRFTVFPLPKRNKKPEKKSASPEARQSAAKQKEASAPPPKTAPPEGGGKKGGSIGDFMPLVRVLLDFMNQFRKKLRVNRLQLKLVLAGDDPCDLAVNYGRAWAALGGLLPMLEKVFVIGKRDCEVECDFTSTETRITAQMELTLRVGQLVSMGAVYGFLLLKELFIFKKKRKGGAVS